jgi:hypothetical protein
MLRRWSAPSSWRSLSTVPDRSIDQLARPGRAPFAASGPTDLTAPIGPTAPIGLTGRTGLTAPTPRTAPTGQRTTIDSP